MDGLEERVRRSSRIKDSSAYREFLAYACLVSDEDEIYSYMEENKIGINEPEFWAAKLTMLKNKCEYKQFMKVLKQIQKNYELGKHPKYWLIDKLARQLQKQLDNMVRRKARTRGKKSAAQYEFRLCEIEKQTRKFGKIQVYVDPDCRMQYRLEDLIDFVTSKFQNQCDLEKNIYLRQISKRPLSFLGKQKDKLDKLSLQILGFRNNRLSNDKNASNRLSMVGRKSNKNQYQIVQTPDFKKKSANKENKKHRQSLNQLDSIQILKLTRKSIANQKRSRKKRQQRQQCNPQYIEVLEYTSSVKKQRMRKCQSNQQQIFSEPNMSIADDSFSFADNKTSNSQQKQKFKNRTQSYFINKQKEQQQRLKKQNENDIAFIQQTQPDTNIQINGHSKYTKQSLELQNVIKQIQMQRYQSQTMSQIDSNKQNNILSAEQDIFNLNISLMECRNLNEAEKRKKFQTIRKDHMKSNNKGIKNGYQSDCECEDQSSITIYKQLLGYLDTDHKAQNNEQQRQKRYSRSAKDNKRKISRISQQQSYTWSQVKKTSSKRNQNS